MGMKEEAFAEGEAKARAELLPIIDEKDTIIEKLKSSNDKLKAVLAEQNLTPSV